MADSNEVLPEQPGSLDLAVATGNGTSDTARARQRKRMLGEQGPTTGESTQWVNWDRARHILGQPFETEIIPQSKLTQMRRDPMIAFGLLFSTVPLVKAPWYMKCTDPKRAAFADGVTRRVWGRFVLAWCNAFSYGYSPMVKQFELDSPDWQYIDDTDPNAVEQAVWPSGGAKALVYKPFKALDPRRSRPAWAPDGSFGGIYYSRMGSSMSGFSSTFTSKGSKPNPDVDLQHALWATNEQDSVFGSLYGYPRIGYAFRYWWSYWYRWGLADRAFEKWADPPVKAFHPDDFGIDPITNEKIDFASKALDAAERLRSGANVAMPSTFAESELGRISSGVRQWDMEQMQTHTNFRDMAATFEMLDVLRLRAVLVPEQALIEGKGGTSSRNVASTNMDSFQESLSVVAEQMDDDWNRYCLPQIMEMNMGPGPRVEKMTTGFDPADIDVMRSIVQVIGNKDPDKLRVDIDALMERLGVPTITHKAFQAVLKAQAEAAAATAPPATPPNAGPGAATQAGVSQTGFYFRPRERIELSDPLVVERIDEIEDHPEAVAFFDATENTLYVRRDADSSLVATYMESLTNRRRGAVLNDEEGFAMSEERVAALEGRVLDLSTKDAPAPDVHVDVHVPPPPPTPARRVVKKQIVRDQNGDIDHVLEEEIDG
jgi:hypothetical protein